MKTIAITFILIGLIPGIVIGAFTFFSWPPANDFLRRNAPGMYADNQPTRTYTVNFMGLSVKFSPRIVGRRVLPTALAAVGALVYFAAVVWLLWMPNRISE